MQFGLAVSQFLELVKHGHDVARHADLVGLGLVGLGLRFLQIALKLLLFFKQSGQLGAVSIAKPLQLGGVGGTQLLQIVLMVGPLLCQSSNMICVLLGQQLSQSLDGTAIHRRNRPNIIPNMLAPTCDPTLAQQRIIPSQ